MAIIKPFKAVRFSEEAGPIERLVCPPYDVIGESRREELISRSKYNIVRLELPAGGADKYEKAGELFRSWINDGILITEKDDSLYIYEMEFKDGADVKKIRGLTCLVRLEPFSKGVILAHEETLSKAKTDRLELIKAAKANLSSVYSLYEDKEGAIDKEIELCAQKKADVEFADEDGVTHRIWIVGKCRETERLCAMFQDKKLYIADGHHRYETALNYSAGLGAGASRALADRAGYILMTLMNISSKGLVIYPTHRVVNFEGSFDVDSLISSCSSRFSITKHDSNDPGAPLINSISEFLSKAKSHGQNSFALYAGSGCWYAFVLKNLDIMRELLPDKSDAYRALDVSVLHSAMLEKALGIGASDLLNQKSVRYYRDMSETVRLVDEGQADCALLISPPTAEEVALVAAAGEKMPQKSTYFYPKLITGLVINKFD